MYPYIFLDIHHLIDALLKNAAPTLPSEFVFLSNHVYIHKYIQLQRVIY